MKFFYKEEFQNSSHYFNFEIEIINHYASYSYFVQELVSHLLSSYTVLNNYHMCIHKHAGKKLDVAVSYLIVGRCSPNLIEEEKKGN